MKNDETQSEKCTEKVKCRNYCNPCNSSGAIYGLGVIGAIFYFVQTATSFGTGVIGIIKAIFWPAILMYELLKYLKL